MDSPQYIRKRVQRFQYVSVLNLIINGQSSILVHTKNGTDGIDEGFKPYYKWIVLNTMKLWRTQEITTVVLNLIINGQSSIHTQYNIKGFSNESFKPYYKWIVLNTRMEKLEQKLEKEVLNLIINGQSSIQVRSKS